MIPRYTRPTLGTIWSPAHRFQRWLEIERRVCEALARRGRIPWEAVEALQKVQDVDPARVEAIEAEVRHDVIAFLTAVSEQARPAAPYLHLGMTSSDLLDTGLALLLVEAAEEILKGLQALQETLRTLAFRYRDVPMVGRTHGVHAEPITLGLKMALWYEDTRRSRERMERAREVVAVGKISGAVGTYAHLEPEIEAEICQALGLRPDPISTQVIQRDRHAEYMTTLALIAGGLEKMAVEIRHLQRTEVLEVEEPFATGQKGSSAMPHKRNPVACENISGLARVVRANCLAALENIPLWHERDISHSSVERVILPDSTILVDYMIHRMLQVLQGLQVYPERMRENLDRTGGLIYSQSVLLALVSRGVDRDRAYRMVQRSAMAAWRGEGKFLDLLLQDPEVRAILSESEIRDCFRLERYLAHVETIFARVFGPSSETHSPSSGSGGALQEGS